VKFTKKATVEEVAIDMTPMIDMVFQLIIFFMLLINFEDGEQNEEIQLPASTLARPPEAPPEFPIVLHVTKAGTVLYSDKDVPIGGMGLYMRQEREQLKSQGGETATVIIRADATSLAGKVQELIQICQDPRNGGFDRFVLRVKEDVIVK
jgi:biopolymer transport protein ExbD